MELGAAEGRTGEGGGPPEIIVVNFMLPIPETPEFSITSALFFIESRPANAVLSSNKLGSTVKVPFT